MASCHHVMLLLDTAGGAAGRSPVRRAALRLLLYLGCRFGLARVRWAFRFFDSQGARGRPSRVSDFRELGARSWEDFEEELEARLGGGAAGARLPGPAPRAAHTHGALMETLLDYQWDRPEITSPAKPAPRRRGRRLLDAEGEAAEAGAALGGFGNAVFLLGPCPRSQRELVQFVAGCEAQAQAPPPTPKQVMDKLLPRRVQEVMVTRKVTLYWVDTTERSKLWESPDHLGYWTVCELLQHVGGTVLPLEALSPDGAKAGETLFSREPHLSSWVSALPTDSILNCLLYNSPEYEASFPRTEGTLFLPVEEVTKVRRNLFTQEMSPSKRPAKRGLPRSHSVSAVEGLQHQPDSVSRTRGHHRLLTRTVAETPEHKQVCGRLLHRQIKGRSSDPGPEIDVVEESPEKGLYSPPSGVLPAFCGERPHALVRAPVTLRRAGEGQAGEIIWFGPAMALRMKTREDLLPSRLSRLRRHFFSGPGPRRSGPRRTVRLDVKGLQETQWPLRCRQLPRGLHGKSAPGP